MLRFLPDHWSEGLLRPLLLADPAAGLYLETHAPDWRFALLFLFLLLAGVGALFRRPAAAPLLSAVQARWLVALAVCFYLWTFVSGNGRYFIWALLLIGPLVVVAARRIPGSRSLKNTAIAGALAIQGIAVWMTFEANAWNLRPWRAGPGLTIADTPLREKPAVFLSIGWISYSILVPQMHPNSRWANITGQQDILPGMSEYPRFQELLRSPLPKYVLFNAARLARAADDTPLPQAGATMRHILEQQNLRPLSAHCEFVAATVGGTPFNQKTMQAVEDGFWFCPVEPIPAAQAATAQTRKTIAPELDDVFERIERHCPRYFPSGNAQTRLGSDGVYVRHFSHSDTSLYINEVGAVYFKYFRSLNPTEIGLMDEVRAGNFKLDCQRLPGRYRPPWVQD